MYGSNLQRSSLFLMQIPILRIFNYMSITFDNFAVFSSFAKASFFLEGRQQLATLLTLYNWQ